MNKQLSQGLGWRIDLPDPRDYCPNHPVVIEQLCQLPESGAGIPESVDLRSIDEGECFSPPHNQGAKHTSTAFACLALVEYFERRIRGVTFDGSTLFLHEMSQRLSGIMGGPCAGIRTTFKALRRYGVPPEEMFPYESERAAWPDVSLLGFGKEFESIVYFRLDDVQLSGQHVLNRLLSFLTAGFPVVFGFSVPRGQDQQGRFMARFEHDSYRGGQTVLAVGFDSQRELVLIRSSWGTTWGQFGYGWLPYSFITNRLARDLWTMIGSQWVDPVELFRPPSVRLR